MFDKEKDQHGRDVFPDGIYFGLPNADYHADPALGSSNIRDLLVGGPTYWWNSGLNPDRKRKNTRALDFGSAMHAMILEGPEAFAAEYACEPDPEGALVTLADMHRFLRERHEVKLPRKKDDAAAQCKMISPSVRIYDHELEAISEAGQTILSLDDFSRIAVASAMITKNPALKDSFTNGIAEVSVFWRMGGERVKCRFDYLRPNVIADLKTLGNTLGKPFPIACRETIARRNMLVQAALYLEGRQKLQEMHKAGRVFGDVPDMSVWRKIRSSDASVWAWVFIQSVEAPITWASSLQYINPLLEFPRMQLRTAIETFQTFMGTYGLNEMWLLAEPVTELDQSELPGWYVNR